MLNIKKTVILICIITLLFSIAISATALTTSNPTTTNNTSKANTSPMYSYDTNSLSERTFDLTPISNNSISNVLTYRGTVTEDLNNPLDVYCDTYKNEYLFDDSSNVLGYIKGTNVNNSIGVYTEFSEGKEFKGDKSLEAAKIAADFAAKLYGDSFNEYKLTSSRKINDNYYDIYFDIPLGKEGLFSRRSCFVRLDYKGNIIFCVKSMRNIPDDFDVSLLNGITKEKLTTHAIKEAYTILGDVKAMEIKTINLKKTDDGYSVVTEVFFTLDAAIPETLLDKYEINLYNSLYSYSINIYYPLS